MHAEYTAVDILTVVLIYVWVGVGAYITHRARDEGCGIRILLAFLFTKGLIAYYTVYIFVVLYRTLKGFIVGIKEGRAEKRDGGE